MTESQKYKDRETEKKRKELESCEKSRSWKRKGGINPLVAATLSDGQRDIRNWRNQGARNLYSSGSSPKKGYIRGT